MDGWAGERAGGWTDGRTDGRTDGMGNKTIHRQDNSSTRFLETIHRHN